MPTKEKLLKKIENGPRNVRFDDLIKLMRAYGFSSTKSKDGFFVKHDKILRRMNIPKPHGRENKVHKPYVDQCLVAISELQDIEKKEG